MKKYWTHRDESVQVKNREKVCAGKSNGIIQKNIALSVIYTENLWYSQDCQEVIGRQWFARLDNSSYAENYFGKTVLY